MTRQRANRRGYIYARVSPKSSQDPTSVDRQIEVLHTMAAAEGVEIVNVYADRLVSASKAAPRKEFERMLIDLDQLAPGDVVFTWVPDRLYRRPMDLERIVPLFERRGLVVQAKEAGTVDLSTPDGLLQARIYGALAARETALKSQRVRLKFDELVAQGRSTGGGRAYGFLKGNHAQDPAEAKVLVEVVDRYLGGEPLNALARELNDRGLVTPRGKAWTNTTLRAVLANPRIAGIRTATDRELADDGETVVRGKRREVRTATWKPIISEAKFRRVQAMLDRTARERGRPARVFTGLVVCGRPGCGAVMTADRRARSAGGHPVYSCSRPGHGCRRNSIRADLLEPRLEAALVRYAHTYRAPAPTVDTADAEATLAEVAAGRKRLGKLLAAGDIHADTAAEAEIEFRAQEAHARGVLRAAVEATQAHRTPAGAGELAEAWYGWGQRRKRLAAPDYIAAVVVAPYSPGRRGWNPERVLVRFHGAEELTAVA